MKLILEKVFAKNATELEGILIIKNSMFVITEKAKNSCTLEVNKKN